MANLRGDIRVRAGAIGQTWQTFQVPGRNSDPRPDDLITRARVNAYGLLSVTQGDGTARLLSVGDAVFRTLNPTAGLPGAGLWTDRTKTSVFAAGGDITLSTTGIEAPSTLSLVASEGSIYGTSNDADKIQVRPSLDGGVEVLAADSIYRLGLGARRMKMPRVFLVWRRLASTRWTAISTTWAMEPCRPQEAWGCWVGRLGFVPAAISWVWARPLILLSTGNTVAPWLSGTTPIRMSP
ncbi:hypothetical protein ASALC70_01776 [Alcanivorax sp. ALC70]|nr:hypothetical protein ASALC70_01776 [Alcanivorax sp. ALC70]